MSRLMAVLVAVTAQIETPDPRSLIPDPYVNVQQQPSFSARTESVRDVLVTEGGRIVQGLSAVDFEIRDEGVVQTVDLVSFQQLPIHVILIRVLEEFRSRYLVSFSPKGAAKSGWHRLEVRIKGRRVNVKARPGYMAN